MKTLEEAIKEMEKQYDFSEFEEEKIRAMAFGLGATYGIEVARELVRDNNDKL
jgi:ABC-type Na+ transport system ATPase subunit NatA